MTQITNLYTLDRNREIIFIELLDELRSRIIGNNNGPYNLVRKGAILRLLLIDGSKFYQTINRRYKLNLEIIIKPIKEVNHSGDFNFFIYETSENGIKLNIPNFINLPIIKNNSTKFKEFYSKDHVLEEYSISLLIKLIANAHGGVHFEDWGSEISGDLMTCSCSPFNLNSNSKLHQMIDSVSKQIILGLSPLYEAVSKNLQDTKPIAWESKFVANVID